MLVSCFCFGGVVVGFFLALEFIWKRFFLIFKGMRNRKMDPKGHLTMGQ